MKPHYGRGIAAGILASVLWALVVYIFHPSHNVVLLVSMPLGASAMLLGLWWGKS